MPFVSKVFCDQFFSWAPQVELLLLKKEFNCKKKAKEQGKELVYDQAMDIPCDLPLKRSCKKELLVMEKVRITRELNQ